MLTAERLNELLADAEKQKQYHADMVLMLDGSIQTLTMLINEAAGAEPAAITDNGG
jgi:hypothetical protein